MMGIYKYKTTDGYEITNYYMDESRTGHEVAIVKEKGGEVRFKWGMLARLTGAPEGTFNVTDVAEALTYIERMHKKLKRKK